MQHLYEIQTDEGVTFKLFLNVASLQIKVDATFNSDDPAAMFTINLGVIDSESALAIAESLVKLVELNAGY